MYPPLYVLLLPVDVHVLFSFHSFCYNVVKREKKRTGKQEEKTGQLGGEMTSSFVKQNLQLA
jgi:hypothetical protein